MPIRPRRVQRSRKLCAFHVKNATGLTAVRSSRLPSTRQKTVVPSGLEWRASRSRFKGPGPSTVAWKGDMLSLEYLTDKVRCKQAQINTLLLTRSTEFASGLLGDIFFAARQNLARVLDHSAQSSSSCFP